MKICFLAAANSIHSVRWIKYFYEKGHEISWISLAPPMPEAQDLISKVNPVRNLNLSEDSPSGKLATEQQGVISNGVKYFEIAPSPLADINGKKSILYLLPAASKIKKILKDLKPDILHIHSAGTYGLVGALTNFKPVALTPWGSDILLTSFFKKPLIKFVLKRITLFTCDGENTTQALINLGVKPEKIKMIRFGTDVEKFKPVPRSKIQDPRCRIISLRTLIPIYDIETLVKAAAIVVKAAPEAKFIIAGDGEQKEYLISLSKNLGLLPQYIEFIGRYKNENLPQMLNNADIYVSTSLSDSGLAASTAEAMATELPVIVSDSGDNKEWVDNNFVIPVKNPEILAEKIIYLIKNGDERKKLGKKSRETIEEKNNYYKEMEKMEKLYEKVIAEN